MTDFERFLNPDDKLVYVTEFGSKLYGTDGPDSDTDYKGIYLPSEKSLITGSVKHHIIHKTGSDNQRNTKDDIDIELWSIHKFTDLLLQGDTGALDMFFSMFREDQKNVVLNSNEMLTIMANRKHFLSKKMKAFLGYAMGQAQRFGIKGSRYGSLLEVQTIFDGYLRGALLGEAVGFVKVGEFFNSRRERLEKIEHCKFIEKNDKQYYAILGKLYEDSISTTEFKTRIEKQISAYGDRAKEAREGVDWKALSHALRAIFQIRELLETGMITFPLNRADEVKTVKYGERDLDSVLERIEEEMEEVHRLMDESELPYEPVLDRDEFILKFYKG